MAFLKFTKLPKHQKFDYKPRFYDPRKEELEERLKKIEERRTGDIEGVKTRISGGFKRRYEVEGSGRRTQVIRSNLTLLGIIVSLAFITYKMLVVYLPRFVEMLESK
ncbi:MAG: hypothetical protein RJA52_399 [Bacteroidota bacterium]|jgi:hypothetical protein